MTMKEIIQRMIQLAEDKRDYEMIDQIGELMEKLALTSNAPSNWRIIGAEIMRDLPIKSFAKENFYKFGFYESEDGEY